MAEEKKWRAEKLIEDYARAHASTAFVAGQLGGQFGFDRIPLTALTVSMINDLCELYDVRDGTAKGIHIATAIGRLTLRGTVIAQTLLNWIPILGPAANGVTTYFLTKGAGWDCVHDISENRMNLELQAKKAVQKGIAIAAFDADVGREMIQSVADGISDEMIGALTESADLVAGHGSVIADMTNSASLNEAEKTFLTTVLQRLSRCAVEGGSFDIRVALRAGIFEGISMGLETSALGKYDKLDAIGDLERIKTVFSDHFRRSIDASIIRYTEAVSRDEKKEALAELMKKVNQGIDVAKQFAESEKK